LQVRHLVEVEVQVLQLELQGKQLLEEERYLSEEHVWHPVVPPAIHVKQVESQFWHMPEASLYLLDEQ
jgi:hypothetical protein